MTRPNRFESLFAHQPYVALKNYLYNYRLRKRAVEKARAGAVQAMTLDVGCGISPMATGSDRIVYTDLSFSALHRLRGDLRRGHYVVADAMNLPFKARVFAQGVASEVLEHLPDDVRALREIADVLDHPGRLIVTFPHRRDYFAIDDVFVGHYRRYDLRDMEEAMEAAGLRPVAVRKVMGPLEKMTMIIVAGCIRWAGPSRLNPASIWDKSGPLSFMVSLFKWANGLYAAIVRLDAIMMPRRFASVLLMEAEKSTAPPRR